MSELRPLRETVGTRAVEASDYPILRRLELSAQLGVRWRVVGHPSPERYPSTLWDGVQAQHLVFDSIRNEGIGLVTVYDYDAHNRLCKVAAARFANGARVIAQFAIGFEAALQETFDSYDVRKIYLEVPDFNFGELRSLVSRKIFTLESTLKEYRYYANKYWDQHFLSIDRTGLRALTHVNDTSVVMT